MTTFTGNEHRLDDFLSALRCNGECWCGVHGMSRFDPCLALPGENSHRFCRHLIMGECRKDYIHEPGGAGTPTVETSCSKCLFIFLLPFDLIGVNACEDYISSVNRAIRRISRMRVRYNSEHEVFKILSLPLKRVRRMPVELHHLNDEVPGSSPGGSSMRGHSSIGRARGFSKTLSSHSTAPAKDRRQS